MNPHARIGTVVGVYRLEHVIGSGGFGTVYSARDTRNDMRVAVKLLHPDLKMDPRLLERFRREAEVTHRAGNPHIVRVLDASLSGPEACIVFELLTGDTLANEMRNGPMTAARAVHIIVGVLDGLSHAHSAGVIHRDIKPANIFLVDEPGKPRSLPKILDFGIGRLLEASPQSRLTRTGTALGTPYFMAPEQVSDSKRVDGRADLYSAAATLFTMLRGEPPYGHISPGEWYQQLVKRVPAPLVTSPIEHLSPSLAQAVAMGLALDPATRFLNAGAFARALVDAVPEAHGGPVPALDQNPSYSGRPPARTGFWSNIATRRTRRATVIGAALGAGLVLLVATIATALYFAWPAEDVAATPVPAQATATPTPPPSVFCIAAGDVGGCVPHDPTRGPCPDNGKTVSECPPPPSASAEELKPTPTDDSTISSPRARRRATPDSPAPSRHSGTRTPLQEIADPW